MAKRSHLKMTDKSFVSLGSGLYSDPEDDSVFIINPLEILQSRDLEVNQESLAVIYSEALIEGARSGLDVILISNDGVPSTFEVIESGLPPKSETSDSEGNYTGPERRQWPRNNS